MFWTIPALCVESWIEHFNENSKREGYDACLDYGILSRVFSPFLFLYYLILQLLSILQTFSGIAKFVNQENSPNIPEYLMLCGFAVTLGLKEKY